MALIHRISLWLLSQKMAPAVEKKFLNWSQIQSVILIVYDHQLSGIVDFVNKCVADNMNIEVFVIYNGKPDTVPSPHFKHKIITKKDFSFFNLPKETFIQTIQKKYDVLINYSDSHQIQALSLSKMLSVKCRIANFENDIFDIVIKNEETMNIADYLQQVIVYLNMINPNIK